MSNVLYLCPERESTGCSSRLFDAPGGTKIRCHLHPDKVMEQAEEWLGATYAYTDPGAGKVPVQMGSEIDQPLRDTSKPADPVETEEQKVERLREEFKELTGDYPDRRIRRPKRLEEALAEQRAIYEENMGNGDRDE